MRPDYWKEIEAIAAKRRSTGERIKSSDYGAMSTRHGVSLLTVLGHLGEAYRATEQTKKEPVPSEDRTQ